MLYFRYGQLRTPSLRCRNQQVAQSLNIRTHLLFPPKHVILALRIIMTLAILMSGFPVSRDHGRD